MSSLPFPALTERFPLLVQTSAEEGKQEKKTDQPPQAKKAKVKTKVLDLPIENNPQWQLAIEMLNLFVENEVSLLESYSLIKFRVSLLRRLLYVMRYCS